MMVAMHLSGVSRRLHTGRRKTHVMIAWSLCGQRLIPQTRPLPRLIVIPHSVDRPGQIRISRIWSGA